MAEAKKVSCAEDAKIRAKFHAKDLATQKLMTPAGPDFKESQLRCLSKAYPDTVALLSKPGAAKTHAAFKAYQRETLKLTGELIGTQAKSAFEEAAKALTTADRRKSSAFDVAFELVAGWHLRGYRLMTPEDRADALKTLGLIYTPEAIRKKCARLKLSSARKRGRPANK
jgi:hypothetical protein